MDDDGWHEAYKAAMERARTTYESTATLAMSRTGLNGDGVLDAREMEPLGADKVDQLSQLFDLFDTNKDGLLSEDERQAFLRVVDQIEDRNLADELQFALHEVLPSKDCLRDSQLGPFPKVIANTQHLHDS